MTTRRRFLKQSAAGVLGSAIVPGAASAVEQVPAPGPEIPWHRSVPVRYTPDVAVVGGGIAGVTAALAAAKSGVRVLLIERFAVTGGNATVGGVGAFCGETAGQGEAFDVIVAGLEAFSAIAPYQPYAEREARVFDSEILAIVLQELLLRRGVRLLLHTQFVDVCVRDGRISECIVCGPSGPEAVRAAQYVDCTGEAQVAHLAGFQTSKGRAEDGLQLPMSIMSFVRHVPESDARPQVPDGWFEPLRAKEDLPMTSVWPNGPGGNAIKIKIPGFDATDTESLTDAEIRGRRRMMEVLDWYQRGEAKSWRFERGPARIGIREGRRVTGEYTLTLADLRAGRKFDDAVARGVFYLDGHRPDDDKRTYILPPEERVVPPYQIPLRCLLPRGAKNLAVAGRCLSAEQLALSSARVMTTCAMMGQAAGIASALAVEKGADLAAIDPAGVRAVVEARGALLTV